MFLLTPEFLTNLPSIVFMWTCVSLCWGTYAYFLYRHMIKSCENRGWFKRSRVDRCNSKFILLANVVMFAYLIFDPMVRAYAGDAFIIINIFYNVYLLSASTHLYHWWKRRMVQTRDRTNTHQQSVDQLII